MAKLLKSGDHTGLETGKVGLSLTSDPCRRLSCFADSSSFKLLHTLCDGFLTIGVTEMAVYLLDFSKWSRCNVM